MDAMKPTEYGKYSVDSATGISAAASNYSRKAFSFFGVLLCIAACDLIRTGYEKKYARMSELASTDSLTNVKSRALYEKVMLDIDKKIRDGKLNELAIVVCDVNGLKTTNDSYGHSTGDKLLQNTSYEICHVFSHSPVFRIGGDEFVAILTGEDYQNRSNLLDELKKRSSGTPPQAFFAFGCSDYKMGFDKNINDVFERADAQMYRDKKRRGYARPQGNILCG